MTQQRKRRAARKDLRPAEISRKRITRQEIQDVLADEGYSADRRKGTLKEILTALVQEQTESPTPERAVMIDEVKKIIDQYQEGEPIAKDVLRSGKD